MSSQASSSKAGLSYTDRIPFHSNAAAKQLLALMDKKQTNLCVSVDVTKSDELLEVVRRVGKSCCMVKVSQRTLGMRTGTRADRLSFIDAHRRGRGLLALFGGRIGQAERGTRVYDLRGPKVCRYR